MDRTAEGTIHVAVVEDSGHTLEALRTVLQGTPGFACIGAYSSGEQAMASLPQLSPDVVLMDIGLPAVSGIECIRRLRWEMPSTRFMIHTVFEDHDRIFEALRAGASGYLLKKTPPAKLLEAIQELHQGGAPMSAPIAAQVVQAFREPARNETDETAVTPLSPREAEVLSLLNKGLLYKEIADRLGISVHTVRTHITRIYEKLQVRSRAQAILRRNPR